MGGESVLPLQLCHWKTRSPASWPDIPLSHIILTLRQPVSPILIMQSVWVESDKYSFLSRYFDRSGFEPMGLTPTIYRSRGKNWKWLLKWFLNCDSRTNIKKAIGRRVTPILWFVICYILCTTKTYRGCELLVWWSALTSRMTFHIQRCMGRLAAPESIHRLIVPMLVPKWQKCRFGSHFRRMHS